MAGRGRGRGGRGGMGGFTREQLDYMGAGPNYGENQLQPVTQPAPLYPLLENKPVPLNPTTESNYMLILKQDFLEHMRYKSTYVNFPAQTKEPELEIDKLIAQLPKMQQTCTFDWRMFPKELRTKMMPRRSQKMQSKEVDVDTKLQKLEKLEKIGNKPIKQEAVEADEEEEEAEDEEQDEEMDEGTDYVNNYFDNGEDYEEDMENDDDGPIY